MKFENLKNGQKKQRYEFTEGCHAFLIKAKSVISTHTDLEPVRITVEIHSENNRKTIISDDIPLDVYGRITSMDGLGRNSFNTTYIGHINEKRQETKFRQVNLTAGGNIELNEDEKLVLYIDGAEELILEMAVIEDTFTASNFISLDRTLIKEGFNVKHSVVRAHSVLLPEMTIEEDVTCIYQSKAQVIKSTMEMLFQSQTNDIVSEMIYDTSGKTMSKETDFSEHLLDLTGTDPIVSLRFEAVMEDSFVTECILKKRNGLDTITLTKKL